MRKCREFQNIRTFDMNYFIFRLNNKRKLKLNLIIEEGYLKA